MAMLVQLIIISLAVTSIRSAPSSALNGTWYHLTLMDGDDETKVELAINEDQGIEIYKTESPNPGLVVKDFNMGVEALIPDDSRYCYVKPLDSSKNTPPSVLKSEVEKIQDEIQTVDDEADELYFIAGYPIMRTSVLGDTIADKCDDREAFWLIMIPGENGGRRKRGCTHRFTCSVQYYNGQWIRSCGYVLSCTFR